MLKTLMALLGSKEDDEFEDIVTVFQTCADKLKALAARKESLELDKRSEVARIAAEADVAGEQAAQAKTTLAQVNRILGVD